MRKQRKRKGKFLTFFALHLLSWVNVVTQIGVFLLSTQVSLFPAQESLQSMVSSFAEILAGLYGITLAGYTFFLSRIDALMASDATLDFVVSGIKRKYKYLIWHITYQVAMTLLFTAILMLIPVPENGNLYFLYRLSCNEFLLFLSFSVGLILYYSISVVSPNSIEKEARKQKCRLCDSSAPGSAAEFIELYDRITEKCRTMVPPAVEKQLQENKGRRFDLTMDLLRELHPEFTELLPDLERVHRYYGCMVNTSPLTAAQEMCSLARQVLAGLELPDLPEAPAIGSETLPEPGSGEDASPAPVPAEDEGGHNA